MASLTPWLLRSQDPLWRNDHDYNVGAIRTGSDGAMYTAIKENGPNTEAGVKDPTKSADCWMSLKDSLSIDGPNYLKPEDIGAVSLEGDSVAPSATKLETERTLAGVAFDGTGDIIWYGACATAGGTAAKTVALEGFKLGTGAEVTVKFNNTVTSANPTLNVNNTGAKAIFYNGAAVASGVLRGNRFYRFVYDGTRWNLIGDADADVKQTATTTNAEYPLLATVTAKNTATKTEGARFASAVTLNPSTQRITAKGIKAAASGTTFVSTAAANGAAIDTSVSAGTYFGIMRYPSDNGVFTHYGYDTGIGWRFFTDAQVSENENTSAETLSWSESGVLASSGGFSGALSGNASTASKLATARTIALSGAATGSASFDGSKNITITATLANSGVTAGSYGLSANVTPADGATFNVPLIAVNAKGLVTSAKTCTVKLPTNVGTADKLTTARYIDGVSFNGGADITHYGVCSTAAGTAAKVVSITGFKLVTGATVKVRFSNANTASNATLNVTGTGAKTIKYKNAAMPANLIEDEGIYDFVYDGSAWQLAGGGIGGGSMPIGAVCAFSGTFGGTNNRFPIDAKTKLVNTNWCLCDGTATNGVTVPDLRGRFIMGANSTYTAGSTGGSASHNHSISGTVGEATLTVDQLASHQHWIATSHNGWGNAAGGNGYRENGYNTDAAGGSQAHTHDISNGATGNASILPPYYALSYIIRIM